MSGTSLSSDPVELTRFIETRYHASHRTELPEIAALAQKVEQAHAGHDLLPAGLSGLLRRLIGELEVHMKKEELMLFPAMRKVATTGLDAPIASMRADHDDHAGEIARIAQLTHNMTPPEDACRTWAQLYDQLYDFVEDLQEHIRLENEVLFPQFEAGRQSQV